MADQTGSVLSGGMQGGSMGASFGPYGALIGAGVGAAAGFLMGEAASKAKKKAQMEELRRADLQRNATQGQARAAAGASGLEVGGSSSMSQLLEQMAAEFTRQRQWQLEQIQKGGDLAGAANGMQLAQGIGSGLFRFGESQNWFQGKPQVS